MSTRTPNSKWIYRMRGGAGQPKPMCLRVREFRKGDEVGRIIARPQGGQVVRLPKGGRGGRPGKAFAGAAVLLAGAAGAAGCNGTACNNDVYNSVQKAGSDAMHSPTGAACIGLGAAALVTAYFAILYLKQKGGEKRRGPAE